MYEIRRSTGGEQEETNKLHHLSVRRSSSGEEHEETNKLCMSVAVFWFIIIYT